MYATREGSRGGQGMDSQQQFCLKWNSFGSNLATAFSNLWRSESLADVTLFCGGRHFKAHRLILAACSKHFQELFKTAPPTHAGPCYVILEATSAENMQALLEFMYKGEVHVSSDALPSFLKSAESLQVKGLSIEHEKLAYAQTFGGERHAQMKASPSGGATAGCESADSPMPPQLGAASFAPILAPYALHPLHPLPSGGGAGAAGAAGAPQSGRYPPPAAHVAPAAPHRRSGPHKPSPSPSPHARNYRPSSSSSHCDEPDTRSSPGGGAGSGGGGGGGGGGGARYDDAADCHATPTTTTGLKNNAYERSASAELLLEGRLSTDQGAEDLRVKMETEYHGGYSAPPTPTAGALGCGYGDKPPAPSPTPPNPGPDIWTKKLASSKSGGIATADGKKLKCPFCERLYGYETNLRAHIRQRHQGIRVPCPYCARTFTRNNTVRRHIAREHKHDADLKQHLPPGALPNHAQ